MRKKAFKSHVPNDYCVADSEEKLPVTRYQASRKDEFRPKGVRKAQLKHQSHRFDDTPSERGTEPSFADRFFALPGEIRNIVYRMLLVQPCKFEMGHRSGCVKITSEPQSEWQKLPGPRFVTQTYGPTLGNCARCFDWGSQFRSQQDPNIFVSPARSAWAPPLTNSWLCDNCHRDVARPHTQPSMRSLPCLCTRRENLAVLVANRSIYSEASAVFWTENCFAFETAELLKGFLTNISSDTMSRVKHISFRPCDPNPKERLEIPDRKPFREICGLLRRCTGLARLEFDVAFLSGLRNVLSLRSLNVSQRVVFVRDAREEEMQSSFWRYTNTNCEGFAIWPYLVENKPGTEPGTAAHRFERELTSSMLNKRPLAKKRLTQLFDAARAEWGEMDEF